MKHWTPRIADAVERALETGASTRRRPRARAALLAALDRGLPAPGRGRRSATARSSRSSSAGGPSRGSSSCSPTACAAPRRTSSSPRTASPSRAPATTRTQLLETSSAVAERAGLGDWSFSFQSESPTGVPWLGPDILDHLRTLHAARRASTCSRARSASSPTTSRSSGTSTSRPPSSRGAGPRVRADRDAERRSRASSACSRAWCDGPLRYLRERDPPRRDPDRRGLATLSRLSEGCAHAQGADRHAWPRARRGRLGALGRRASTSSRARRSGSSGGTARARRRC